MPPVDADQFESEINAAKTADVQAQEALKAKREEGRSLSQQVLTTLLRNLFQDNGLKKSVRLVKRRKTRQWVFEIAFPESQLMNLQPVSNAMAKVRKIWDATGLKEQPPVSEDKE